MTKLNDALIGVTSLGFDTFPVIYFVEAHPRYDALVTQVFQQIADAALTGWTSVITLSEVLVQPLLRADVPLQQAYREILLNSFNFHTLPVTAAIAEQAASMRARYRLRTPDALQIATALEAGGEAFLCNDAGMRRVTELRVLVLDELEL